MSDDELLHAAQRRLDAKRRALGGPQRGPRMLRDVLPEVLHEIERRMAKREKRKAMTAAWEEETGR